MRKVREILKVKGNKIFSVAPDTFVYNALEQMYDRNISSLIVMEGEKMAGIFTERDYARKVVLKGKSSKETLISEIMTKNLITVSSNDSIEEAMRLMSGSHIRHLPVIDENKLTGLISISDVVTFLIEEQKYIIGNLESYIAGA